MTRRFFTRTLLFLVCFAGVFFRGQACSPLNVPGISGQTLTSTNFILNFTNTATYLNCPNVIDVEFACNSSNFSGFAIDTYTTAPQSFPSSPYAYTTQTIAIGNLCPGTVYKFRIRERNNNTTTSSSWSSTYTFVTQGVYVPPTLVLTSSPNLICPPAPVQLNAFITNTCGRSGVSYVWFPQAGLNNPNIANPIANITTPTSFTCIVSGGATGCWNAVAVMFINVGTGPPVPGIASVTPSVLCVYNSATLSSTTYTGNLQWQSATSASGPWTNIPGAVSASLAIPSVSAATCYQGVLTSCSGATAVTNVVCATTNTIPTMAMAPACSGTTTQLAFTYTGTSGSPTAVVWSPLPLAINANSTIANYNSNGTYFALAFFGDGCISSSSINLTVPTAFINTSSVSCSALGSATIYPSNIPGPYSLQWLPISQTNSVATSLFPGTHTCNINYNNNNCVLTTTVSMISTSQLTGTITSSPSLFCPNVPTATAAIVVGGGSGFATYTWNTNGTTLTPTIGGLGAGVHTVSVLDQNTYCTLTQTFFVNSVPNFTLNIAGSLTACVNSNNPLNATNSGGTPPYTYTWVAGPASQGYTVSETTSGLHTYTVISQDANGCTTQQVHGINFISLPVISVTNAVICPGKTGTLSASGASTYTWNNNSFYTGSTFTASPNVNTNYNVVGTLLGCSASGFGSMNMLPVPSPTLSSNSPICNGQNLSMSGSGGISYSWSGPLAFQAVGQNTTIVGASSTRSGIYSLVVTGVNTCTSSVTASLTVYSTPALGVAGSTVCSTGIVNLAANSTPGASYQWSGPLGFSSSLQNPNITSPTTQRSGFYTVIATSVEGCTNTAVAHVTVTQLPTPLIITDSPKCTGLTANLAGSGGLSYQWFGPNGYSSNVQNPVIPNMPLTYNGTFSLTVVTGPCIVTTSQFYTVYPLPVVSASNGGAVCETKTVSLYAITAGTMAGYAWNGPGYVSALANPKRYPAGVLQSGDYTLTVTDQNGCQNSATTSVTVMHNPNVAAVGATVCTYAKVIMAANGANSYTWTGPGNYLSNGSNASIASVTSSNVGVYSVLGQAANSCTSISTATLGILPLPIPQLNVSPSNTLCLNGTVTLAGGGGVDYKWKGPNDIFSNTQSVKIVLAKLDFAGIYTLVVTDSHGCASSMNTTLSLFPNPDGFLNGEMNGCAPLCGDYKFSSAGNSNKVSANWKIGQNVLPSSFHNCFNIPGTYSVSGFFYDSLTKCSVVKNFTIDVFSAPLANFEFNPVSPIENIEETSLINKSQGENLTKFSWYVKSGSAYEEPVLYQSTNPVHMFSEAGLYSIVLVSENENGCSDTAQKVIEVQPDFYIFVPNVFTPNGDKLNEKFAPVVRGVKFLELSIYNRWGARVFETSDLNGGWDGTFEGKGCMSDIYTWRLSVSGIHGEHREMKGHITLYR